MADISLRQAALANAMENFGRVFSKVLEGFFIDCMEQNKEITVKFMDEGQLQDAISQSLLGEIYEKIRAEAEIANEGR